MGSWVGLRFRVPLPQRYSQHLSQYYLLNFAGPPATLARLLAINTHQQDEVGRNEQDRRLLVVVCIVAWAHNCDRVKQVVAFVYVCASKLQARRR